MVGRRKKVSRSNLKGADGISCLPSNVMEHIMSFLPLREAVKTSVLSREWRNKWKYLPALVFDDNFCKSRLVRPLDVLWDVIYALKLHSGPVREFSLSISQVESSLPHNQIDQILYSLDRAHLESLSIGIQNYTLSSSVFSFAQLRKLQLCSCQCTSTVITFDSFTQLSVLELRAVTLSKDVQVSFSFACPMLSDLTMDSCGDRNNRIRIVIEAPILHSFCIQGSFSLLEFKHTPLLKRVSVHQQSSILEENANEPYCLYKFINGLPAVEHLSVTSYFGNYLYMGGLRNQHGGIAKSCSTLTHLIINEMCFDGWSELWSAISWMNLCYKVEELTLNMKQCNTTLATIESNLKLIGQSTGVYRHLKRVKVNQLRGKTLETALIRWLLSSSPALQNMEIEFAADFRVEDQTPFLKELLGLPRASPTAQITVK